MTKLFKYLRPYWLSILILIGLIGLTSIGSLLLPDFMRKIIGEGLYSQYELFDPTSQTWNVLPAGETCSIETLGEACRITQKSDFSVILRYGGWMLGVTLLSSAATIAVSWFSSRVAVGFGRDIRHDIYRKVSDFSLAESGKFGTSTLITRSTNDVRQVQMMTMMSFRMVFTIPVMLFGGLYMSIRIDSGLTAVLLGSIPLLALLIVGVFFLVFPLFRSFQKKIDKLTLVGREALNGVRVIRAFGQGRREVDRFKQANDDLTDTGIKAGNIMAFLNPVINLVFNVTVLAVLFIAFGSVSSGRITDYSGIANAAAVIEYVTAIMFSLIMLTIVFINFPRAEVAGKRICEILETKVTIQDAPTDEYDSVDFRGNVGFDHVDFKYGEAEKNVLDDITFTAKAGETVAIIGSTGSGKSTIVNLLPRLYDPTAGTVSIDGIDIRKIRLKKLRELIGFIPQTATLFTGTIRENIAFGKPDATLDEIREAARIAQAADFIEALPQGYDSLVEQGGVNFSGGQKQRLSIARAIVRRPRIYVFDDSFSALDFKTDSQLRQALKAVTQDSLVLIVAQRIGTIMNADRILVLQDGMIVGQGTHRELMSACEVYREIAHSQLSEEELGL
jgi:ATP-binding cassette subfamily B protein